MLNSHFLRKYLEAGTDEAGRGCLAGPVTAAAIILPKNLPYMAIAAVLGALIGAEFGSRKLTNPTIRKLLALVLVLAGSKMVLSA